MSLHRFNQDLQKQLQYLYADEVMAEKGKVVVASVKPNTNPAPPRYGIFEVRQEWIFEPEDMGTKSKFWFRPGDAGANWLFKYPRPNTGEHWAEKIASEVAESLDVVHAKVELAIYKGDRGTISESFDIPNHTLFHGNQLMVEIDADYEVNARKFRRPQHTLANIWRALETQFPNGRLESTMCQFAEYLTLDALIGNVDRHHENLGSTKKPYAYIGGFTSAVFRSRVIIRQRTHRYAARNVSI